MENTPSLTVKHCKLMRESPIFHPLNLFLVSNPYIIHNIVVPGRCVDDVVYLEEEITSNNGTSQSVSQRDKRVIMAFFL